MTLLQPRPGSRRLAGALAALLLLVGLGSALAWQQAAVQQQQLAWLEQSALPPRQLSQLSAQVDELRGLLALQLMLDGTHDGAAMDRPMQLRRQAIEMGLALTERGLGDATERAHFDATRASLAQFLAEFDKLLPLSRQATRHPAQAAAARALLTGPSQLAYQRLSADLAAWSAYVDQRSHQASRQARAAAAGLPLLLALQAVLVLGAAAGLAWHLRRNGPPALAAGPVPDRQWADWPRRRRLVDLAGTVDRLAAEARLLALNAAVAAARQGAPGQAPPTGSEEGLRHLAERVAQATQEVRALLVGDLPVGPDAGAAPGPGPGPVAEPVAGPVADPATKSAAAPAGLPVV